MSNSPDLIAVEPVSIFETLARDGRPIVFYAGPLGLPESGASIEHAINVGKALEEAGYRAILLPFGEGGRQEDLQEDGTFQSRGISYIPIKGYKTAGTTASNPIARKINALRFYSGAHYAILDFLEAIDVSPVRGVIAFEAGTGWLLRLNRLLKRRNVPVISEEVEWFQKG